jgi:hypothetical protein
MRSRMGATIAPDIARRAVVRVFMWGEARPILRWPRCCLPRAKQCALYFLAIAPCGNGRRWREARAKNTFRSEGAKNMGDFFCCDFSARCSKMKFVLLQNSRNLAPIRFCDARHSSPSKTTFPKNISGAIATHAASSTGKFAEVG